MNPSVRRGFALYPGSFDPFTFGHLDVLERALRVFDAVEVVVAINARKKGLLTPDERCTLIRRCTDHLDGVTVASFEGLVADYARQRGAAALIRGLRNVHDFDYEIHLAHGNRQLHPDLETVFFLPSAAFAPISSTIVRDVHRWGGDISAFVPPPVVDVLRKKR